MNRTTLRTRRDFLKTGVLGGALSWTVPAFLERTFFVLDSEAADSDTQNINGKDGPILVILQMAGGNDGLNTVIPHSDDVYHSARPRLAVPADQVLRLDDRVGLHSRLGGLRHLYDSGEVAIIQGVGYPNPNRSHFRSTDIWQTASDANRYAREGWIGGYFDSCCRGEDPAVGVSIGRQAPLAFAARTPMGITFSRPEQFRFIASSSADPAATEEMFREMNSAEDIPENSGGSVAALAGGNSVPDGGALEFIRRASLDAQISSDRIREITRKTRPRVSYPNSRLASDLGLVARLIAGGMPTRVYYVSQGGYDTHSGQAGSHERLLSELDGAFAAFVADLKEQGNFDRVLLMTFSEFGRRVAENSSGGTDHGAAAPLFVLGGGIRPGVFGRHPSLTDLHDGDLVHGLDFRSVYATVLEKWLKAPASTILKRKFPILEFV